FQSDAVSYAGQRYNIATPKLSGHCTVQRDHIAVGCAELWKLEHALPHTIVDLERFDATRVLFDGSLHDWHRCCLKRVRMRGSDSDDSEGRDERAGESEAEGDGHS
ncbi:MAG TPA: hypothetical protein VMB76_07445, partial [Casimicrobiaceae bacterium]|nr:hypothetical protein [Casimicrobiaceae bacterium]